jgi:hypothetical protein
LTNGPLIGEFLAEAMNPNSVVSQQFESKNFDEAADDRLIQGLLETKAFMQAHPTRVEKDHSRFRTFLPPWIDRCLRLLRIEAPSSSL